MKYFFLIFITTSVFAVDFTKVTGAFDLNVPVVKEEVATKNSFLAGTFDSDKDHEKETSTEDGRTPSSVFVNEITGSFR